MPSSDFVSHSSESFLEVFISRKVIISILAWIVGTGFFSLPSRGQNSTFWSNEPLQIGKAADERYRALYESNKGEITVYYDYLENNQLAGGITTLILPEPADSIFPETMLQWSVTRLIDNGPSANRLDIVFLGDGYTDTELDDYADHVINVLTAFMAEAPLAAYASYFNVHRVDVISNESGVDEPDYDIYRDTALDMTYDCSGIARLLCVDVSKAFTAASSAPETDQILALANSIRYGGAGYLSSDLATLAGNNGSSVEIALHEFGHSFASLADEYDSDGPTYAGPELVQSNISIYDSDQQLSLQRKWYRWLDLPEVDAFEGAHHYQYGIYRPTSNSKMRTLGLPFEAVNEEQFVINIYKTVFPIDDATPSSATPLPAETTFFVTPLQPVDHALDIQWSLGGTAVPGATDTNFTADWCVLSPGIHEVSVTVVDNTDRVRDETARATWMTFTRSWQIEVPFRADITEDGRVDLADVMVLHQSWLQTPLFPSADIAPCPVPDNRIDLLDFALLSLHWLE